MVPPHAEWEGGSLAPPEDWEMGGAGGGMPHPVGGMPHPAGGMPHPAGGMLAAIPLQLPPSAHEQQQQASWGPDPSLPPPPQVGSCQIPQMIGLSGIL